VAIPAMTVIQGFDVSHWQGHQDWTRLKKDYGLEFAFAKCLQGESSSDSEFTNNWNSMGSAGIVRGAYLFGDPDSNPNDDADALLNRVNPSKPDDLLVLDLESSTLSASDTAQYAYGFGDRIRSQTGGAYNPGIYCGGYADLSAYKDMLKHFGWWWYPRYPSKYANKGTWPTSMSDCIPPDPNTFGKWPPDIWQFSQSFPTNQGGAHDANIYNGTLDQMRALNGDDVPSTQEIAKAVWADYITTGWQPDGAYSSDNPLNVAMSKVVCTWYGTAVQVNNGKTPEPAWYTDAAQDAASTNLARRTVDNLPTDREPTIEDVGKALDWAFRSYMNDNSVVGAT
jgi:GH25 family lysozyme M1 (1,4-beta-N-acetylmuramidase)